MQKEKKIVILSQASTVFCHNFRKKDIIHDPIPSSKVNPIRNKPKGSPPSKEENEGSVALCSDAFFSEGFGCANMYSPLVLASLGWANFQLGTSLNRDQ